MGAIDDIAAERRRQVESEGWTVEHDDEHAAGQLATAAACYAAPESVFFGVQRAGPNYDTYTSYEPAWPWADMWWKPADRRRNLVKAGALIVAEIERLDRTTTSDTDELGGDEAAEQRSEPNKAPDAAEVVVRRICDACFGSGRDAGSRYDGCARCGGTGSLAMISTAEQEGRA